MKIINIKLKKEQNDLNDYSKILNKNFLLYNKNDF